MVKDHSHSESGNQPLPLPGLLLHAVILYAPSRIAHITAFAIPVMGALAAPRNSSVGPQ